MAIKIRKFTNKDLFTVIDMLKVVAKNSGEFTKMISSRKTNPDSEPGADDDGFMSVVGMRVLIACYEGVKDDCISWFASLCCVNVDEFLDMPAETSLQVIEQIVESEDAKSFFTSAWSLFKKIGALRTAFSTDSRQ